MFVGIDLGTGSAKAALVRPDGTVVAVAAREYPVLSPRPGWAETPPQEWFHAVAGAVREVVDGDGAGVRGIGLSGQMHGVVLTAADGTPCRPAVLWPDGRASAQLGAFRALPASARRRLANPLVSGMAGATLLWLREAEPDAYRSARWALPPKDWLRLQLVGEAASEPTDASATLLYDLPADEWARDVVAALGLREDLLPDLVPSASAAGTLRRDAAEALGVPAGIPVAAGAADTAAAALGSGLVGRQVQLVLGTGGQFLAPRDELVVDETGRTHVYRAAIRGWYAMAAVQSVGLTLGWVRRTLGVDWAQLYDLAFAAPLGARGVRFLPHLAGERSPHLDESLRGGWIGLGLGHGREELARAALEGVAFALREGLAALEATGVSTPRLRVAGGGSLDPRWRQLLADVLRRPLLAVDCPDASARGAAMLAAAAADGTLPWALPAPRTVLVAAPRRPDDYEPVFEDYRRAFAALRSR